MVCTSCMTYNHAPYIVDAMNGFTMQETTFPVYYLITDDASTDGEPEVIKQYLADHFQSPYRTEDTDDYYLICAVHKTNPNCNFIVFFLKYNHYSIKKSKLPYQAEWRDNAKYIALCEGDDYWIDSMKLQKQVDFLESHPDYSMCFTDVRNYFVEEKKMGDCQSLKYKKGNVNLERCNKSEAFYYILLGICRIQTLSVMYSKNLLNKREPNPINFLMGDTPLWLHMSQYGIIKYLDDCTGVYRIHNGSVSRNSDTKYKFRFSMYEMRVYYCIKYGYDIPMVIKWAYNKSMFSLYSNNIILDREPLYSYFPILNKSLWEKSSYFNKLFYRIICIIVSIIVITVKKIRPRWLFKIRNGH